MGVCHKNLVICQVREMPECWDEAQLGAEPGAVQPQVQAPAAAAGESSEAGGEGAQQPSQPCHQHGHRQAGGADLACGHQ